MVPFLACFHAAQVFVPQYISRFTSSRCQVCPAIEYEAEGGLICPHPRLSSLHGENNLGNSLLFRQPYRYTTRGKHRNLGRVPINLDVSVVRRLVSFFLIQNVTIIVSLLIVVDVSCLSLVVCELFFGCKQSCCVWLEISMARVRWVPAIVRFLEDDNFCYRAARNQFHPFIFFDCLRTFSTILHNAIPTMINHSRPRFLRSNSRCALPSRGIIRIFAIAICDTLPPSCVE